MNPVRAGIVRMPEEYTLQEMSFGAICRNGTVCKTYEREIEKQKAGEE